MTAATNHRAGTGKKLGYVAVEVCIQNPGEKQRLFAMDVSMSDRINIQQGFNDVMMSMVWGALQEQLEYQMRKTINEPNKAPEEEPSS